MDKQVAIKNLIDISSILSKHNVKHWLTDGTLLGLYRDKNFIEHDKDTDIGVDSTTFNKECFFELQQKFNIHHVFGYVEDSFEIALMRDGVKTDLFFFYENGENYYHCAFSDWRPTSYRRIDYVYQKFDVKKTLFLDNEFYIPEDPHKFVITKYGENWNIPNANWRYDYSPLNHVKTEIWIDKQESVNKFQEWLKK